MRSTNLEFVHKMSIEVFSLTPFVLMLFMFVTCLGEAALQENRDLVDDWVSSRTFQTEQRVLLPVQCTMAGGADHYGKDPTPLK